MASPVESGRNGRETPYELQLRMATALTRAIQLVGNSSEMAAICGVSVPAVSQWERAPANHCITIERACERQVTRYQLRPDIFGDGSDV